MDRLLGLITGWVAMCADEAASRQGAVGDGGGKGFCSVVANLVAVEEKTLPRVNTQRFVSGHATFRARHQGLGMRGMDTRAQTPRRPRQEPRRAP